MPGDSSTVPGATVPTTGADLDGSARILTLPFARKDCGPAASGAWADIPRFGGPGSQGCRRDGEGQGRKRGEADTAPAHQVLSACRTTASASVSLRMDCSKASRALARTIQSATAGWSRRSLDWAIRIAEARSESTDR